MVGWLELYPSYFVTFSSSVKSRVCSPHTSSSSSSQRNNLNMNRYINTCRKGFMIVIGKTRSSRTVNMELPHTLLKPDTKAENCCSTQSTNRYLTYKSTYSAMSYENFSEKICVCIKNSKLVTLSVGVCNWDVGTSCLIIHIHKKRYD